MIRVLLADDHTIVRQGVRLCLEAIGDIRRDVPQTEVVVLSVHDSEAYVVQALRAGAAGYVLKRNAATELAEAIRAAQAGQAYLHPTVARRVIDDYLSRIRSSEDVSEPYERLTPREREVLQLAAEGHTTRSIAGLLCLSTKTVEHHRASLMTKLGLHGQTELVKYAIRAGLVEPT